MQAYRGYKTKVRYMNITGEAINSLSKRSRIPPCPGNIFPESFTPAVRLSKDSHKSPQVEKYGG